MLPSKKSIRSLQSGQGYIEYALLILLIAVVAIPVVSILASPENFRNGAIYQNIYLPILCRVQGQAADCTDIADYNYPTADNPNSGKDIAQGGDGTGTGTGGDDTDGVAVTGLSANEVVEGFNFTLSDGTVIAPGTYSFTATATGIPEDVDFSLTGDATGSGNDFDSPFVWESGIALAAGSYTLTATPNKTGETSQALTVSFTVDPSANPDLASNLFMGDLQMFDVDANSNVGYQTSIEEGTWDFNAFTTTNSGRPSYVIFEMTGPVSQTANLTAEPWQMFGGSGVALTAGSYTLSATPYDEFDDAGTAITINFTVTPPPEPISVTGLVLVDSDADTTGAAITDGGSVTITGPVSFQANIEGPVQSVDIQLTRDGSPVGGGIDSGEPYTVFGDASGNYNGQILVAGNYTLTAIPYRENGGQGEPGDTVTVNFAIQTEGPSVTGINLINADSNTSLGPLNNGDTLSDWTNISFQALTNNETQSVRIEINGVDGTSYDPSPQNENAPPYSAFGDSGGNYTPETLAAGNYEIIVTPYAADDQPADQAGLPLTYRFTVVEVSCPTYTLVRISGGCSGSTINFQVQASCGPDTTVSITSPASFSSATITSSIANDPSLPEREQEFNFIGNVNTSGGIPQADIDAVCAGSPMDLTVTFADGTTQVYEYGNALTTLQQK
jgi:hypothetical protein